MGDRASANFGLTVAHAIPHEGEHLLEIETAGRVISTKLQFIDRDMDLALLLLPDFAVKGPPASAADREACFLEPSIGASIRLISADGVVVGNISAIEVAAHIPTLGAASSRLQKGMFEVQLSSAVEPGISGAPVMDESGQPFGIVVAAFQSDRGSMHAVLARPIHQILREMDLSLITTDSSITDITVGVLTTSEYTLGRLLNKLVDPTRISRHGDAYFQGRLGLMGPNVVAAMLSRIGNIGSAIVTTKMLGGFDINYVMLLGTCGGLKPDDQQLGDVVVSSDILYYEPGAIATGRDLRLTRIAGSTPRWLSGLAAGITIADRGLSGTDMVAPRVHVGSIASGEKVVRDTKTFASLLGEWQSALAVEMEAAGVAEAVSSSGGGDIPFVVIRGIADFADASKDDRFRDLAADRAVDVGAQLLDKLAQRPLEAPSS